MQKYIIEREIPQIGEATNQELRQAAIRSNAVLAELGPDIQWVESYVSGDRMFCIYLARDEELIRRHAELSGFPATRVFEVRRMIDPTTASAVTRIRA
jgi:hypothetical protein